jgi:hypothetical protein
MNTLLCDFENKILQTIYKALGSPKNCVMCFDGLMIRKEVGFDLEALEKAVYDKLDIEIKLAVKAMTEGFDLDAVPLYVEKKTNCFDFTDPYNYNNFHSQFNNETYASYEDMEDALAGYPNVIAHILQGEGLLHQET